MKVKSARSEKKDLWKAIPNDIWVWIESYTRRRARKTGYLFGLNSAEVDDLHQELMVDVAKRWRFYDPTRSPHQAFVSMLVRHRLADFAKNKIRTVRNLEETADAVFRHEDDNEKPHRPRILTLNETVWWSNGDKKRKSDGSQFVTEDDHRHRRQIQKRSEFERLAMQADVRNLVSKLPQDLQIVCEYVMKYGVPSAAKRLDMPASTLRYQLHGLQELFADVRFYIELRQRDLLTATELPGGIE